MRRPAFAGLLAASTISLLGSRMSLVAVPWLVLATTGSAAKTGIVAATEAVPMVLAGLFGAPLIDRLGGRRVSIAADLASAAVVGSIPLFYDLGDLGYAGLCVLVAIAGFLRGFGDTAKRGALFTQSVAASGVDMTRATSLVDGFSRAAGLVGVIAAGALVALLGGAAHVIYLDAASFALCGLLVAGLVRVPGRAEKAEKEPYFQALRAGAVFLRGDRLLLGLMAMLFATNMFDQAFGSVLVPVWARDIYGSPFGIAIVSASFSVGAVTGNIAYTVLAPRLPRWSLYSIGFLIAGAPRFYFLAFGAPTWAIIVLGLVDGVCIAAVNPILGAVMYERVPETLQARVSGLGTALAFGGMPLGSLLGGWLADHGVRQALIIIGTGYLIATLAPFAGRFWREMDRRPAPRQEEAMAATVA
ncbi:MFS transporter [Hamadaea tsunoensis]|uniref:MFS transporter n=1 Tax=Hamadaea tsunoensis TaxID=53368 RepID=UPI00042598D7|nr:MFS transporter [Hamadaea tsunoensis]